MKQILQNLKSGETTVSDVPAPQGGRGRVLIRTTRSLISAGTERMLVEFGQAGLLGKAKAQPEKVKQVLEKVRTDGLMPTLDSVFKRLDEPLPLGYCNVGVVVPDEVRGRRSEISGRVAEDENQSEPLIDTNGTLMESKGAEGKGQDEPLIDTDSTLIKKDVAGNSDLRRPTSDFRPPTFDFRPPTSDFRTRVRVVSNGPHAEVVCVPKHLCAKIPDNVSDEEASFTVLASIGLQGIRLAEPTLGEKFVVFGAGLIGLVTIQLLRANGCGVLAVDLNPERLAQAKAFGAEICNAGAGDPIAAANAWTEGNGVDGVLITASAKTDDIMHQAAEMCRKRARIILVGVVGLNLSRADFYEKELTFQVSCSYGPGRYDDTYELKGQDYPRGFVRWTEKRNFEAVLDLMASGRLDVKPLISHRFALDDAPEAYEAVQRDTNALGVILEYGDQEEPLIDTNATLIKKGEDNSELRTRNSERANGREPDEPLIDTDSTLIRASGNQKVGTRDQQQGTATFAMIGAGNFAKMTMAPALAKSGARLKYVSDLSNGPAALHVAKKYGFEMATSDTDAVLADEEVDAILIATGHSSHAALVCKGLAAGKHVFVEKPLAMNEQQVQQVIAAYQGKEGEPLIDSNGTLIEGKGSTTGVSPAGGDEEPKTGDEPLIDTNGTLMGEGAGGTLMVGFNRRFSPHTVKMKELLAGRSEPLAMVFTANAGIIPPDVWVHDPEKGGGRIIGEACHYIDLLSFIADSPVVSVASAQMGKGVAVKEDKMSIVLSFADGSVGTVNYFGNGHKAYPKERMEVYSEGRILHLDNFRVLRGWGFKGFKKLKTRMDKGHQAEFKTYAKQIASGGEPLIPFEQLVNVTRASFAAMQSANENQVIRIPWGNH